MRRMSMVTRPITSRVLVRRRQHEKKSSLEEDDERDDIMEGQASTPGTSLNSLRVESSSREPPQETSATTSRDRPATTSRDDSATTSTDHFATTSRDDPATVPAFSDDMLSSMTRTLDKTTDQAAEEQLALLRKWLDWSVDPDSVVAFFWKAVVTVAVIYNCAVIILRTAFTDMRDQGVFLVVDVMSDVIYVIDMILESKTSFLQDGCLVTDSNLTLRHYREKRHFLLDILSVFPLHSLLMHSAFTSYEPIFRLNRVLKSHTMDTFFQRTESRTNNPNLVRALKLSLHLGLVIHWIACLYYMLSEFEDLGSNDWVYPLEPNMTRFSRKYIVCMFWSTMTLTTIGERAPPVTDLEYIFTGFTFLVGVFVFAAVVGNVGDVISNLNAARRDFQARMDQIKFYMNHRNVPEHLQTRVKKWAEYTWDRTQAMDEPSALQFLPNRLRTEMAIHVHLDTLKKVPIFGECEEGLLRELVLKLRPQIFSPGDYICRIGEIGREMYIINHGRVEILIPDLQTGDPIQVLVMQSGNFFGEISLLKLDDGHNKRTADVRSVGFSELLCLSRRDLIVALAEYPAAKQILEGYARRRFNNTRQLTPTETEDCRHVSPRVSCVSAHRKRTTRQIFTQALRQEGFSKLLSNVARNRELEEIRTALEELKAIKTEQVEESILNMQKKIQELERLLVDKNVELTKSQARVSDLEKILMKMGRSETALCRRANRDLATDFHTRRSQASTVADGLKNDNPDPGSIRVKEEGFSYSTPGVDKSVGNRGRGSCVTLDHSCSLRSHSLWTTDRDDRISDVIPDRCSSKSDIPDSCSCKSEISDSCSGKHQIPDSCGLKSRFTDSVTSIQHEIDQLDKVMMANTTTLIPAGSSCSPHALVTRRAHTQASTADNPISDVSQTCVERSDNVYDCSCPNSHTSWGTSTTISTNMLSESENTSVCTPETVNPQPTQDIQTGRLCLCTDPNTLLPTCAQQTNSCTPP